MKSFKEYTLHERELGFTITNAHLQRLEKELDKIFKSVGIDITFTKHFMDRVRDSRGGIPITLPEIRDMFRKVFIKYRDQLSKYKDKFEAVLKDRSTDINVPFVIKWNKGRGDLDIELVSKTIMRKQNFKHREKSLPV